MNFNMSKNKGSNLDNGNNLECPKTGSARGVQITEFVDFRMNPKPAGHDVSDSIMQENLSPQKLQALTGCDNLRDVTQLELQHVNTSEKSLGNFGVFVPNLEELRLKNSTLSSIRDLGSSLKNLKVLWLPRCGVNDLDGLSLMDNLTELYLAYNDITDLSHFSMLENLEILDLEGNNIDKISQVSFLLFCKKLQRLTLDGNPICIRPHPDANFFDKDYNYIVEVKGLIGKQLKFLNDKPISNGAIQVGKEVAETRVVTEFDDDWNLLEELMQDGSLMDVEELETDNAGITTPSYRPGTALKPSSAFLRPASRLGTSRSVSTSLNTARSNSAASGPRTASSSSSGFHSASDSDGSGILTNGPIVCGNLSRALIMRKRGSHEEHKDIKNVSENKLVSEDSGIGLLADEENLADQIFHFKMEHKKIMERIEANRSPQVLKIDHLIQEENDEADLDEAYSEEIDHQSDLLTNREEQNQFYSNIEELASSPIPLALKCKLDSNHYVTSPRDILKLRSLRNKGSLEGSYHPHLLRKQKTVPSNEEFYQPTPPLVRQVSNLSQGSLKNLSSIRTLNHFSAVNEGRLKELDLSQAVKKKIPNITK